MYPHAAGVDRTVNVVCAEAENDEEKGEKRMGMDHESHSEDEDKDEEEDEEEMTTEEGSEEGEAETKWMWIMDRSVGGRMTAATRRTRMRKSWVPMSCGGTGRRRDPEGAAKAFQAMMASGRRAGRAAKMIASNGRGRSCR